MSVHVFGGDHTEMVWRDLQGLREKYVRHGHEVREATPEDWQDQIVEDPFMAAEPSSKEVLVVVEGDPGPKVLEVRLPKTVAIAVQIRGNKMPSWVKGHPKKRVHLYTKPKPWEADEAAMRYVLTEAKMFHLQISNDLAAAMVKLIGTSIPILRQELTKLAVMLRASRESLGKVDATHIRRMCLGLGKPSNGEGVIQALTKRDPAKVSRMVSKALQDDHILKVVAFLKYTTHQWLLASIWKSKGKDSETIAGLLSIHPFRYKKQIGPALRKWSLEDLDGLVSHLADIEVGSKEGGYVDPATRLESILVQSCLED